MMGNKQRVESYMLTDLKVSGLLHPDFTNLPRVFTQRNSPVSKKNIPTQEDIKNWSYLSEVTLPSITAVVGLLIRADVFKALEQ